MASGKVSQAFNQAFGRMSGIDEAKAADASMSNIPFPVGWKGRCVVLDMVADVSKQKEGGKGNVPYIAFTFASADDPKYAGKKCDKPYYINETTNAAGVVTSAATKYERFLNDMEYAGLPREIRERHDSIDDIVDWWVSGEEKYINVEIVQNGIYTNINLRKPTVAVDNTESMSPAPAATINEVKSVPPKTMVQYGGKAWELVSKNGDILTIKSTLTNKEKQINVSEVEE